NPLGTVRSFCHLQRQLRWHKFGQRFFGRVLQFAGERSTWGCGGAASVLAMVRRYGYCFLLRWRRRFLLFLLLLAALRAPDVILIFGDGIQIATCDDAVGLFLCHRSIVG